MSTTTASYQKFAHGRNAGTIVLVALLTIASVALIVAGLWPTLSEISPQTNAADVLPLVWEPVVRVPAPMPPARDLQQAPTGTAAAPVNEWASPASPSPMPVPTPPDPQG